MHFSTNDHPRHSAIIVATLFFELNKCSVCNGTAIIQLNPILIRENMTEKLCG